MKCIMLICNSCVSDPRVFKEAKYLVKCGHEIEIIAWDREEVFLDNKIEFRDGFKIKRMQSSYAKYGTGLKQMWPYVKFARVVKKYLNSIEYDILHAHDMDAFLVASYANIKKQKIVFDMHEYYSGRSTNSIYNSLMKIIWKKSMLLTDYIIYVDEIQLKNQPQKILYKSFYLPNYPELRFNDISKQDKNFLVIGYIGGIRQFEEIKNLVIACKNLENVRIHLYGSTLLVDKIRELEEQYENLQYFGPYDYEVCSELYQLIDLTYAVYPNSYFAFNNALPVKFFESVVTSTPLIVNKNTKLSEIVMKKSIGYVVDADDVQYIKNTVAHILKNKNELAEFRENMGLMRDEYSWESVVSILDNIYNR